MKVENSLAEAVAKIREFLIVQNKNEKIISSGLSADGIFEFLLAVAKTKSIQYLFYYQTKNCHLF